MATTDADMADLGGGLHVWLPPDRGWGLANCGLLTSRRGAAWIDAPYDRAMAGRFLARSTALLPRGAVVDRVIVTHANGDHFWGAGVLPEAEIIATRGARAHLRHDPDPCDLHALVRHGDPTSPLGAYLARHFGRFDWADTDLVRPTTWFTGELELTVGGHPVHVTALPPGHTEGDLMVHLPHHRTVFSGDVVFGSTAARPGDHPVHWAGPLSGLIASCETVLATGAEVIVPGHGPVLDRAGVGDHIRYLAYVRDRAHALHAAGVPVGEAARRIVAEGRHPELGLPERLLVTVGTEYRHLDGTGPPELLALMADVAAFADEIGDQRGRRTPATASGMPVISYRASADPVRGRVAGTPNG